MIPVNRGPGHDVELGLAWDFDIGAPRCDLDAAAVLFDNMGVIKDACFYNKMSAANGSVRHSGDNRSGEGAGDDEFIGIDLDSLEPDIKVIMFLVTAYTEGGSFKQVKTARAQLRDVLNL
jgi:tellurium resistance protein TerZ